VLFGDGLTKLSAVAAWRIDGGHALMTMGLSTVGNAVFRHELSGAGYEIVWRLRGDVSRGTVEHLDRIAKYGDPALRDDAALARSRP